jgi:hypothetical protein
MGILIVKGVIILSIDTLFFITSFAVLAFFVYESITD